MIAKLGPDPLVDDTAEAPKTGSSRRCASKPTPIGLLLMDQSVVSGIGNVYRAELLFRARHEPAHARQEGRRRRPCARSGATGCTCCSIGVETGQMMTMDDLDDESYRKAMASRDDRHWVYKREGLPCRVCGTNIVMEEMGGRKLYWCPVDQA